MRVWAKNKFMIDLKKPTHQQHLILEGFSSGQMNNYRKDNDADMEDIWQLVRTGYLKNLVILSGNADWKFILTENAVEYLDGFSEAKQNGA
ncbi:hypothetical protein CCP3SC1AL1_580014 [Gammaproteobacteria bacterium]